MPKLCVGPRWEPETQVAAGDPCGSPMRAKLVSHLKTEESRAPCGFRHTLQKQNLESSLPSDVLLGGDSYRLRPGNVTYGRVPQAFGTNSRFCFTTPISPPYLGQAPHRFGIRYKLSHRRGNSSQRRPDTCDRRPTRERLARHERQSFIPRTGETERANRRGRASGRRKGWGENPRTRRPSLPRKPPLWRRRVFTSVAAKPRCVEPFHPERNCTLFTST